MRNISSDNPPSVNLEFEDELPLSESNNSPVEHNPPDNQSSPNNVDDFAERMPSDIDKCQDDSFIREDNGGIQLSDYHKDDDGGDGNGDGNGDGDDDGGDGDGNGDGGDGDGNGDGDDDDDDDDYTIEGERVDYKNKRSLDHKKWIYMYRSNQLKKKTYKSNHHSQDTPTTPAPPKQHRDTISCMINVPLMNGKRKSPGRKLEEDKPPKRVSTRNKDKQSNHYRANQS